MSAFGKRSPFSAFYTILDLFGLGPMTLSFGKTRSAQHTHKLSQSSQSNNKECTNAQSQCHWACFCCELR